MNLPNKLSLLRIILVPVMAVVFLLDFTYAPLIAVIIFILAAITDFFDGRIARKYNMVTNFGKFMDPLADKLLVCAALICFLAEDNPEMPAWVVIIIISREFIISGFRLVAAEKGVTIAASYWGKVKTVVQMAMSIVLIFDFTHPWFRIIDLILIYASLILTVISLVDYIYKNRDVMKEIQ